MVISCSKTELARNSVRKKPVLLQHGFLDTSAAWVINPSDSALGISATVSFS